MSTAHLPLIAAYLANFTRRLRAGSKLPTGPKKVLSKRKK